VQYNLHNQRGLVLRIAIGPASMAGQLAVRSTSANAPEGNETLAIFISSLRDLYHLTCDAKLCEAALPECGVAHAARA